MFSDEFVSGAKNLLQNSKLLNLQVENINAHIDNYAIVLKLLEEKRSEIKSIEKKIQALTPEVAAARKEYLSSIRMNIIKKRHLYKNWISLLGEKDEYKAQMEELSGVAKEYERTLNMYEEKVKSLYSQIFSSGEALFGAMANFGQIPFDEGKKPQPQSPDENGPGAMGK